MSISSIIPLIAESVALSLKIASILESSKEINIEDKEKLKKLIASARDKVTYWEDEEDFNINNLVEFETKLPAKGVYLAELNNLYNGNLMVTKEYNANLNVIYTLYITEEESERILLKRSIDRTLARYGVSV